LTIENAPGITLPVPTDGLDYVLRAWVGRGQLVKVLNCLALDELPRDWRPEDTQFRADLMLFLELVPLISQLPPGVQRWIDLLPAQSRSRQTVAQAPTGGTSWIETRRRHGWPPTAFVIKRRDRVAHELLSSVLAWTGAQVLRLAQSASSIDPLAVGDVREELTALSMVFDIGLVEPRTDEPLPSELAAVAREGTVWRRLVNIARTLRDANDPVLAAQLLWPRQELRPTLFQLGVLGELLLSLNALGASIVSKSPLSVITGREQYHIAFGGRIWHLWMEAGGSWRRYRAASCYRSLVRSLATQTRPLSPDLMLISPGEAAFIIECKYSASSDYVGRTGLAQTLLYMTDVGATMATAVEGIVVAPEGIVGDATHADTPAGRLGLASPNAGVNRAVEFLEASTTPGAPTT
jgi:hypothetical protein